MRGPSGVAALSALVVQAEDRGRCPASQARNRAVALLLLTNALRRGEIGRLAMADWSPTEPLQLAIRGKGRKEREKVTITPTTAEALEAWMALRPDWMPSKPWAPLFCALDQGAKTRAGKDLPVALEQARANASALELADPGHSPKATGCRRLEEW